MFNFVNPFTQLLVKLRPICASDPYEDLGGLPADFSVDVLEARTNDVAEEEGGEEELHHQDERIFTGGGGKRGGLVLDLDTVKRIRGISIDIGFHNKSGGGHEGGGSDGSVHRLESTCNEGGLCGGKGRKKGVSVDIRIKTDRGGGGSSGEQRVGRREEEGMITIHSEEGKTIWSILRQNIRTYT